MTILANRSQLFDTIREKIQEGASSDPVNAMIAKLGVDLLEGFLDDVHGARLALEKIASDDARAKEAIKLVLDGQG